MTIETKFLTSIRHPQYLEDELYWYEWRETYEGGPSYVTRNLKKFSNRETDADFTDRKAVTPIPSFAKAAVNDIRNSIFQRLRDISRRGGSENYMRSCSGEDGGVDNKCSSMQTFLGIDVLTELLVMGRVGVYVDMPVLSGFRTMADEGGSRPYCYMYRVEDILSWTPSKPEEPGDFSAILLRDYGISYNQGLGHGVRLPSGSYVRYRAIWIDENDRKVKMKIYNEDEQILNIWGTPVNESEGIITLDLERIPFSILDIGGSLLKDVYKHQVALLNLGSSDVAYALKANFPFYTEQKDMRAVGGHLKKTVDADGTSITSDNTNGKEARTGVAHGRVYDLKADRPGFIHPSSEPLMASIKLQEKIEDDIRKLVNLEVQNKTGQKATSAEAMKLSDQGLEAGLSYIGMVLESAERRIAHHWASYESKNPASRKVATIKYPDRYSLKNDDDRISEAQQLAALIYTVPGKTVKKELAKNIVTTLLAGKVNTQTIDQIFEEINTADYTTSDPEIIIRSREAGLVGEKTASMAIGFNEDEHIKAQEDHINRAVRIMQAQLAMQPQEGVENAAARGIPDLDVDKDTGKREREEATDTTMEADVKKPVRGQGKRIER